MSIQIIHGIYALLDELRSGTSRYDSLSRIGGERSAYENSIYRGRLHHMSVSAKKSLQKDVIDAIIKSDKNMRQPKRRQVSYTILKNRKKSFKQESEES